MLTEAFGAGAHRVQFSVSSANKHSHAAMRSNFSFKRHNDVRTIEELTAGFLSSGGNHRRDDHG